MKIRGQKKLKLLDRYIGIPIAFLLGLLKTKGREFPDKIKQTGVLLTPAIGDTILISASLKDLKENLKPEKIVFFVPEGNKEAAELINIADEIVLINFSKPLTAIRKIRSFVFDLIIDSSQWSRANPILIFFSKSKYKIGFDTPNQYKRYVFDKSIIHSDKVHEIINYRNLINLAGINSNSLPEIKSASKVDKRKISIHLKAGGYLSYLKEWPDEYWIEVVEYLRSKGYNIFFTGSENDFDSIENFLGKFTDRENLFNIAGKYGLRETADHLKSCILVLSVNTGIMHLASAVGANLIALHGPTNPLRWGPLSENAVVVQSKYFSVPCLNLGFEYNCNDRTGECMKAIPAGEVIQAIDVFLKKQEAIF